ncbi:MAG: sulfite exporter TauE/SafE family protein, partial [Candidatus Methylumidiphilus sp.]
VRDALAKFLRAALGLLGIVAIFYAGSKIPFTDTMPKLSQQASLGLLFVAGLLTGFHCVGMCGGFIVGYTTGGSLAGRHAYLAHAAYGLGKTLSYTGLGAVFGLAGSWISFTPAMQGAAAIAAGVFLLGFGLNMLHLLPHIRLFGLPMPRWLSRIVHTGLRKHRSPFAIGLLNGLMIACGPLQAMYVMAAGTGSPGEGARLLFFFGLGTLPLLLGFGFLTSLISRQSSQRILQASGAIVLSLGLIMLNRGLVLTGTGYDFDSLARWIDREAAIFKELPARLQGPAIEWQAIRTEVTAAGYQPTEYVLRKGVPVRWTIAVKELTTCNRVILVPKLGLRIELQPGEQTVEFTPQEAGAIPWSCWMGMLRAEFNVMDDEDAAATQQPGPEPAPR